jgi:hypothetical protein
MTLASLVRLLLVVFILVAATAGVSEAQILDRPSRPFRGVFGGAEVPNPNRTRDELTFFADLLGGYDSNLAPEGSVPLERSDIPASGFTGLADLVLRYWHGQAARHIEVEGRGYLTSYQLTGIEPLVGQNFRARGQTMFDRKTRLEGNAYFTRDPFLGFGGYDALPISADAAALANPANGLTTGLSWSQTGIGAVTREWTRQTRTTGSYDYTRREYVRGPGFDGHSQSGQLVHEQNVTQNATQTVTWRTSYRFSNATLFEPNRARPIKDHTVDGGFTYSKNLSRTRRIVLGATLGATRVATVSTFTELPIEYWTPSGTGTMYVDFYRSWSISADYRRGVGVLDGITTEAFVSDAVVLRAGGHVNSRTDLTFATGYSNGRTGDALTRGDYATYIGTAQVRVGIARWAAFIANYNYFNYQLAPLTLPLGVTLTTIPSSFDRHAVRFGLSLWLPLYGGFVQRPGDRTGDF